MTMKINLNEKKPNELPRIVISSRFWREIPRTIILFKDNLKEMPKSANKIPNYSGVT